MNSVADLSGIFIIAGVIAFAQIVNMRETGPWETYRIMINSKEARAKPVKAVCLLSVMLCKCSHETKS